jgi:hypothetical protein
MAVGQYGASKKKTYPTTAAIAAFAALSVFTTACGGGGGQGLRPQSPSARPPPAAAQYGPQPGQGAAPETTAVNHETTGSDGAGGTGGIADADKSLNQIRSDLGAVDKSLQASEGDSPK